LNRHCHFGIKQPSVNKVQISKPGKHGHFEELTVIQTVKLHFRHSTQTNSAVSVRRRLTRPVTNAIKHFCQRAKSGLDAQLTIRQSSLNEIEVNFRLEPVTEVQGGKTNLRRLPVATMT